MSARITIAMPAFNASGTVGEAVASLKAQTFADWRLIAIDDGSSDDTADQLEALADPRILVIRGKTNRGLPARLNQAIALADTPLLARMDADDVSFPERLARQVAYLDAHPTCDVVATNMLVINPDGSARGLERWRGGSHEAIVRRPWSGFHFNHATWLGKIDWFRRFRYREDAWRTEDDDLMLRAYRSSRFARISEILYAYRVDRLSLRAVLGARGSFMRSLAREAVRQGDLRLFRGLIVQPLKMAADTVAIGSGLDRVLLRHRSESIPAAEAERWARTLARIRTHA